MKTIETIKLALAEAAKQKQKAATFHSLVLLHADELSTHSARDFCRAVGATDAYRTEFNKMIAVARKLSELGYSLQKGKLNLGKP